MGCVGGSEHCCFSRQHRKCPKRFGQDFRPRSHRFSVHEDDAARSSNAKETETEQFLIECRKTKPTAITEPVTDTSSLTLEVGDGDLELSSLALSSSYGDIVTSGTVVNSASWNDEGLERIVKSADRGLFPSDTRRFGMDAASLRWGFLLFTVPSPHPSAKVKMKYIFRDQS